MRYAVQITETLERTIWVEAESAENAERQVYLDYVEEDIILDFNDCVAAHISIITNQ